MTQYRLFLDRRHGQPHKIRSILFHLFPDCLCHHVSRKQFIYETLHVFIIEKCAFPTDGFGDQESSARLFRIQCSRMDLYIIQMLQTNVMFFRYFQCISCQMREICGMLVQPADSSTCQNGIICINRGLFTTFRLHGDSRTFSVFLKNVCHGRIFVNCYVILFPYPRQQLTGDLFSCHICMKQNSRSGVCPLSCVGKRFSVLFKFYSISYQIFNDFSRTADHNIDRFFPVFIMTGSHRIFKITVIILFIPEYTDSALCQK